jgi:hypothetical protein
LPPPQLDAPVRECPTPGGTFDGASRQGRPDFTAAELRSRRDLYFVQEENHMDSEIAYRLHLDEVGPSWPY